jgi:hypothetical protein
VKHKYSQDSFRHESESRIDCATGDPNTSAKKTGRSARNNVVAWVAELQLEGLEGDVLGGDEKFAAESTFGGAAI